MLGGYAELKAGGPEELATAVEVINNPEDQPYSVQVTHDSATVSASVRAYAKLKK